MMKNFTFMLCTFFLITVAPSYATITLIDSPGVWPIGGSLIANPSTDNDTIVTISASNVIFDMKEFVLSQAVGNNGANLTGIYVAPNLTNITIKNGSINDISGVGIIINDGCSQIYLTNILISNCNGGGILLSGSTTGTGISQVIIKDCLINECIPTSTSNAYGIRVIGTNNIILENCVINDNQTRIGSAGYGLSIESSSICTLQTCKSINNGGTLFGAGINILQSSGCNFQDCSATNNTVTSLNATSTACGFCIAGSSLLLFSHCVSNHNTNNAGNTMGFYSTNNSNISFQNCFVSANVGGIFTAGLFSSGDTMIGMQNNIFNINVSLINTGSAYSVLLNNTQNSAFKGNTFANSTGTQGYGFVDTTVDTNNLIIENVSYSNTTTGYSVSFTSGQLPVIFAANNNFSPLMNVSPYHNVAIIPH